MVVAMSNILPDRWGNILPMKDFARGFLPGEQRNTITILSEGGFDLSAPFHRKIRACDLSVYLGAMTQTEGVTRSVFESAPAMCRQEMDTSSF